MEIVIGSGNYVVCGCEQGGRQGVEIGLLRNHGHEIDTNADDVVSKTIPHCIIWFANMKSARLFQDQVNAACMRLNGYVIENELKTE